MNSLRDKDARSVEQHKFCAVLFSFEGPGKFIRLVIS